MPAFAGMPKVESRMAAGPDIQRITRLTPVDEVIAAIDAAAKPVAIQHAAVAAALGGVLAADVVAARPLPVQAVALRDGWAVASESIADAGSYAPAPLPQAAWIEAGEPMPSGVDAVAAADAVTVRAGVAQAQAPVAPGEGVLPAGGDAVGGATLLRHGQLLLHAQAALLAAAGVENVSIRKPQIRIVKARAAGDAIIDGAVACVGAAVARAGGYAPACGLPLARALTDDGADAVVVIGGTGSGRNDATVRTLAAAGQVIAHGIALQPGETAAFGIAAGRPVLALPGRLDAAWAVWHVLGRHLTARLSGALEPQPGRAARLTHKIASAIGVTELIPVRCEGSSATPIASGYVPLAVLAQADAWVLVRPESEGYPAGSEVVLRPFP
jgi:molybdopterin biosynthesis enzyme